MDFTGPYIMITLILSVLFFSLSLMSFISPQLFKRKNAMKTPNKFVLFLIFFLISIGFLLTAMSLFATQIHKHKFTYQSGTQFKIGYI